MKRKRKMGVFDSLINRKNNKPAEDYRSMSHDELLRLSDSKLEDAISVRLQYEEGHFADDDQEWEEDLQVTMNEAQCTYLAVKAFDMEMGIAGVEGFFDSESRKYATDICNSLEAVGAVKISEALNQFICSNQIDVIEMADQNSFVDLSGYDFQSFDKSYEELLKEEILSELLIEFVRKNIEEF